MFSLKVIIFLYLSYIFNIDAVPIKASNDIPDSSVRPIEEVFQELDGYHHQNDTISYALTQARDGVVRPIEEIFDELDNYQNNSSIEVLPDEDNENPEEEFLRLKRETSNSVRSIEEIFDELDSFGDNTETNISPGSYYMLSDEIVMKNSVKLELEPIDEIFQGLDTNQTTTRYFFNENTQKVNINQITDENINVKSINVIFEELDLYQNETVTESHVVDNYKNDLDVNKTQKEAQNIKPIEDIFQELDNYQNYTTTESNAETEETDLLQIKTGVKNSPIRSIEEIFEHLDNYQNDTMLESTSDETSQNSAETPKIDILVPVMNETSVKNSNLLLRNSFRPGMVVNSYAIDITPNVAGGTFSGRLVAQVSINDLTSIEDPIMFQVRDLNIVSVVFSIGGGTTFRPALYFMNEDDGFIEIMSEFASVYTFIIEYEGQLNQNGNGLYIGLYESNSYLAMNLNPTYARTVFPCMDEPTEESTISFTFSNINYNNIVANSMIEASENNQFQFAPMQGPPHRWGMVAHNFVNVNNLITGGRLFIRSGLSGQEAQGMAIINAVLARMEDWTQRPHAELHQGQNEGLDIFAMPDITKDWNALSSIAIWEPHVLMATSHGPTQRKTAMVETAKAISNQWFGYVIYPENWRFQWISAGLSTHSAFEALRGYQSEALESDTTTIDINAVFVAEVIQESLLRDGYSSAMPLEPFTDIFGEGAIREHVNGLLKFKAPAIMWMLKNVLGQTQADPQVDYVQSAARALLNVRALQPHSSLNFYDAVNSDWLGAPSMIADVEWFLFPWVMSNNYPIVNVQLRTAGVILTQERFSFSNTVQQAYSIPITYTTSVNPNFDNIAPVSILDGNVIIDLFLDEEDWFLANIQGQGYYRVNYDLELWERIILALQNPETRNVIHPLNRATLVDDALNLARAGRLDYDVAFRVVLTMEHETDYSVWKAFIRNMDFIKKRLELMVASDEELDPDIYLRMVRRTVVGVENELGFYPDPLIIEDAMASITRGLVMEHACKSNYAPCVAAAIDWFYDPSASELAVNPSIPHDIRPAVYCTMMREGDVTAREALLAQYDAEVSYYERVVIVRALACSNDEAFLLSILQDSAAGLSQFKVQERAEFFKALIENHFQSTDLALRFIRVNTNAIRDMFGGPERLEEFIQLLAENVADNELTVFFESWVDSVQSNLWESVDLGARAVLQAQENLLWNNVHMQVVYDWIDENDGNTYFVSFALLVVSLMAHVLN